MVEYSEAFKETLRKLTLEKRMADFPSGERAIPFERDRPPKRGERMADPAISERTRIIFSISGLLTLVLLLAGGAMKYGEFVAERKAQIKTDERQDASLAQLQANWTKVEVYMATTAQSQQSMNEKLENLLKINNALLFSAGGERKKVPADN